MENWKTLTNYPNYEVSDMGRVRHTKHKKSRKPRLRQGYELLNLTHISGNKKTISVHRLVAEAYLDTSGNLEVDHIDRVRNNNKLSNLRMVTRRTNNLNRAVIADTIDEIILLHERGLSRDEILLRLDLA